MREKLPRFFLLSFLSFCFFTIAFHAIADAQVSNQPALQSPIVAQTTSLVPTPTIYIQPSPTLIHNQTIQKNTTPPSPTPTIYIAPQQPTGTPPSPTTEPTTKQTYNNTTEIPAVSPTPQSNDTDTSEVPTATPTPTAIPTTQPATQPSSTDLTTLFNQYSSQYNVDAAELEKIAQCESGFNTNSNTGTYAGMYQFLASTWESERALMGADTDPDLRMNAADAIQTAAFMLSRGGENAWPNCH